jgi:hypothetical protein
MTCLRVEMAVEGSKLRRSVTNLNSHPSIDCRIKSKWGMHLRAGSPGLQFIGEFLDSESDLHLDRHLAERCRMWAWNAMRVRHADRPWP